MDAPFIQHDPENEKIDANGQKWYKAYIGSGTHFEHWLAECKELGQVMVEEVPCDPNTCTSCFEDKIYAIWMRIDPDNPVKHTVEKTKHKTNP